jgi:rSAM/selenodomain-associated transferase 2
MTISVVIPVLNEERHLPNALQQLVGMGFEEIIVVDGGSQDRTREIAAAHSPLSPHRDPLHSLEGAPIAGTGDPLHPQEQRVPSKNAMGAPEQWVPVPRFTVLTAPPGRASQMNAGAAAARSEILLFLHADTSLPGEARAEIEGALQEVSCVGGRFDVRFERDAGVGWLVSRLMNLRSRLTGICTGDQAIFVRRSVFERLGGFADLPLMEDVQFSRRLKATGRVAALRAKVVTSYRRWDTYGPIRTILLMWSLRLLYWLGVSPRRLAHLYGHVR